MIGFYQLENLIIARPSFRFLDVRVCPQAVSMQRVQSILNQSTVVNQNEVLNYLERTQVQKTDPIVLMCEDGRLSCGIADTLDAAGFEQLYVVEGGVDSLMRDAGLSG
jgi:rhodanese-related sulfurtransferase